MSVDPITLQVIGGALHSIAEQMGNVLYRMSYSSIIRESQDLGAGLFDTDFNTLCESDLTPMHIGSLPGYLRGIAKRIPLDAWRPGDCVIHNHPYEGSSHSPDIAIVMPVFFEGSLVGFSANTTHHVDIGAATPGPHHRRAGHVRGGDALQRDQALRGGQAQRGDVAVHRRQHAGEEPRNGRPRGADRLRRARRPPLRGAVRQVRPRRSRGRLPRADGLHRADAARRDREDPRRRLHRRGLPRRRRPHPRRDAPRKGHGPRPRRRDRDRHNRLVATGADLLQRPLRGLDQGRLLLRDPRAPPRHLHPRERPPPERGLVPPGEADLAEGVDLQPDRAGRRRGALLPDPAHGGPHHQGARPR